MVRRLTTDMDKFTEDIARTAGATPQQVKDVMAALRELLERELIDGNAVSLPSLGTFGTEKVPEHVIQRQGQHTLVPPSLEVTFTPSLKLVKRAKTSML